MVFQLEATLTHNFTKHNIEQDCEDVVDDIIKVVHPLETLISA
jgi:hypothetical protein